MGGCLSVAALFWQLTCGVCPPPSLTLLHNLHLKSIISSQKLRDKAFGNTWIKGLVFEVKSKQQQQLIYFWL